MNITKLKWQARIFTYGAVLTVFGFCIFVLVSSLFYGSSQFTMERLLLSIPSSALVVLILFHAISLLRSVAKEEVPFIMKNVRHLQWIGWLFVAFEPVSYLRQAISNRFFPISLDTGDGMIFMRTIDTYNGVFLICGFVILAVSTIFQYGIELQQLSDETL